MQFHKRLICLVLLPALSFCACNLLPSEKNGQILAECYGKYLYKDELHGIIAPGTSGNDSIAMARQYIENWVMQQVMLHQAEKNLNADQKDFKDQLESYHNSLVIYAYESELIKQKLDTTITETQLEEFYENNKQNFQLLENIVRVRYVKIPAAIAKNGLTNTIQKLLKSEKSDDVEKLADLCDKSLLTCYVNDEDWIRFDDLLKDVPIDTDNQEDFLKNRTFYETKDSMFVYQIRFVEVKTKEGVSPLSFETDNIKSIILNQRKIELMNKMQKEVFQEALKNKEFTIF